MERRIDLEGCFNFRDLGGYPAEGGRRVAWRRIFRSDGLHRLTESDAACLHGELRLSDVIDLRSSFERAHEGHGALEREQVAFHHVPLFDGDTRRASLEAPAEMTLADRYFGLTQTAMPAIARVVSIIADAEGSAVYHCAAGKDRTGVVSALMLGALGVPDEVIVADYALTRANLDAILERLGESEGYRGMLDALPPDTQHAEPATMAELLSRLRAEHGSLEGYLDDAGVEAATVTRLRERALE